MFLVVVTLQQKKNKPVSILVIKNVIFVLQSETEWQCFLRQCLEIVAKIAELFPTVTFQLLVSFLVFMRGREGRREGGI